MSDKKYCAVICEYNPFHSGHAYLFEQARLQSGCDGIICVMSGSFTQRGEFACAHKLTRAEWAIRVGADMVAELPAVFASAPAPDFAYGAVRLISRMGIVSHICFGSEWGDTGRLSRLSKELKDTDIKRLIRAGYGYSGSFSRINMGFTSNNILAAEYLRSMSTLCPSITPLTVKRIGAAFNQKHTDTDFCSATAVRQAIYCGNISTVQKCLPDFVYADLERLYGQNACRGAIVIDSAKNNLFAMLSAKLLSCTTTAAYGNGGTAERALEQIQHAENYDNFIENVCAKHLPRSKVCRHMTAVLLGITQKDILKAKKQRPYCRILAVKRDALSMLSALSKNIDIITKYSDHKKVAAECKRFDVLAAQLYEKLFSSAFLPQHNQNPQKALDSICEHTKNPFAINEFSHGLNIID